MSVNRRMDKQTDTSLQWNIYSMIKKNMLGNKGKNKQAYIKLKSFCTVKEIINKMKRQPTEWENTFANAISNEELKSKIY